MKNLFCGLLCLCMMVSVCGLGVSAHETVTKVLVDSSGETLDEGVYHLDSDVTYTGDLTFSGKVTLCLNGHTLAMGANSIKTTTTSTGSLSICDCGTGGKITGTSSDAVITTGSNIPLTLDGAAVENTAEDGVAVSANGKMILKGGASVSGKGYSIVDRDQANIYLGACTVNGKVQLNSGIVYAFSNDPQVNYDGDAIQIALNDPTKKQKEGDNSIVQGVTDDNWNKFKLITSVPGYMMVREGAFLKLKKQLDDKTAGCTVSWLADSGILTIAPKNASYAFLREPVVTVDGVEKTLTEANGAYNIALSETEAAGNIVITAVAGAEVSVNTDGLSNATAEAVAADGKLFINVTPNDGYTFGNVSPTVTVGGTTSFMDQNGDIYVENGKAGTAYESGTVTVSGTAYEILINNVIYQLSGANVVPKAGANKSVIITIEPYQNKVFVTPPVVLVDGEELSSDNIVEQADGSYIATVLNGQSAVEIVVKGSTVSAPNVDLLTGAEVTLSPGENEGDVELRIIPVEGGEFLEAPVVEVGETTHTPVLIGDGIYTVNIPATSANGTITVSGDAGENIDVSGTLLGATAKAIRLNHDFDNILLIITPNEGREFAQAPVVKLGSQTISSHMVVKQEDGSYRVVLTDNGEVLSVDGAVIGMEAGSATSSTPAEPVLDDNDDEDDSPKKKEPETNGSGGWKEIQNELEELVEDLNRGAVEPGETITIEMNGVSEVPGRVLDEIAGQDINVEFDMGKGVTWTINGQDIPKGLGELNLGVRTGGSSIPVSVVNKITGEKDVTQLRLSHNGSFGTTLQLSVNMGRENRGLWANLYYYTKGELIFQKACQIDNRGLASWPFDHASSYTVVIDDENHGASADKANPSTGAGDFVSVAAALAVVSLAAAVTLRKKS